MKLRSLSEFDDAVDRETAWRKRELTTILFQAQTARPNLQATALRSGVALLYAHWEGWIKRVGEYYVEYVEQQKLKHDELNDAFLALALRRQMTAMAEARVATVHLEFVRFLRTELGTRAALPAGRAIRTESNLSSRVLLREIVHALGLDYSPYVGVEHLIDERMVARRNTVAHGEYLVLQLSEFEELHRRVTTMLARFTNDILNQAASGSYRRQQSGTLTA